MMWYNFDGGRTIGCIGSENGTIVLDEEHSDGARVTLEQDCSTAPWSVTCGIYGCLMHTAFASDETEGRTRFNEMKLDLVRIMHEQDDEARYKMMHDFADKF